MKRAIFLIFLLLLPLVTAQTLQVQEIDKGSTIISELSNAAVFDFLITNNAGEDNFEIYSLTVPLTPSARINLKSGENKIQVRATPNENFRNNLGFFTFQYEIKSPQTIYKDNLLLKIVPFEDVFEITASPILPDEKKLLIKIKNTQNTNLENVRFNFDSPFFTKTETLAFLPNEEKIIEIGINKDIAKLSAGPYLIEVKIQAEKTKTEKEAVINYLEREGTSFNKDTDGFIVRKTTIKKQNLGNKETTTTINLKKDIISRLFTINSPTTNSVERQGLSVIYTWEKTLSPNETFEIESKTNYTFPFIILLLIVAAGIIAKFYYFSPLILNKKVSFVRTRGGEFALKIILRAKAKKHINKIQLIDTLPGMTKLYEKFGKAPDRIDENSRRLFWNIASLNAGEERVFSYIIYSKLRIVGRFELPSATAIFEHEGKTQETWSNKAFFATEIGKSD